MSPPAEIDLSALPPEIRAAFEAERARRLALEAEVETLAEHNRRLEHLVKEFRQALYGKKSEKLSAHERQLAFEDLEAAVAAAEEAKDRSSATHSASRGGGVGVKRNQGRLPRELPRIERVIEPASILCPCGCGEMARIGEDRAERLDIVPAQFRVIATVRPRYACRRCAGAVVQAPAPAHLIAGALPTERLIAHVLVAKYADHSPLYRQSQIYARAGIELNRSTLADWVGKAAFHLAPVVDRLGAHLRRSGKLFLDETTAPVLDPGRGRTKTGYLWALARDDRRWGGADPPPLSLQRKNALFAGHDEGGRTWARIASLIETCKLNSVDPFAYLAATLEAIADGHPATRIDELMPWAFSQPSS